MTNEQLAILVQNGENVSENMLLLWEQNKGFIYQLATKYQGYAELEDLMQEGYIGLCNAVKHFDESKGASFINYMSFWVKQAMQRYMSYCTSAIRLPEYARQEVQQYNRALREFLKLYGEKPTDYELAYFMGVDIDKLDKMKHSVSMSNIRSLEEPVGNDVDGLTLKETITADHDIESDVVKEIDMATVKKELWKLVDDLPEPYLNVICLLYRDNRSRKEVSQITGLTASKTRRVEDKAFQNIRERDRNRVLHKYHEHYLTSAPILHVGVREFNRTWTSSVEKAVLGW